MRTLLVELSDSEYQVITEQKLKAWEETAAKFDGILPWRVVGYCDELISRKSKEFQWKLKEGSE